ncbi:hypothetical protein K474DRAFT_1706561 [Panus rudis PR-1116 ss-1]|nr:hypothetical protein K474DRAFT_1706561 [Panus rudis PR-1116 ss-1]
MDSTFDSKNSGNRKVTNTYTWVNGVVLVCRRWHDIATCDLTLSDQYCLRRRSGFQCCLCHLASTHKARLLVYNSGQFEEAADPPSEGEEPDQDPDEGPAVDSDEDFDDEHAKESNEDPTGG